MAKLGDAFSGDERRKSVTRRLRPGTVIYLDIAFLEGRPSKYLVVAKVDRECCTFIVNSRIHPFIGAHPSLSVCQVRIDAARHAFLKRDSYIACHEVLRLPTEGVIAALAADLNRIKDRLHTDVVSEVIAAVKRAPTLGQAQDDRIHLIALHRLQMSQKNLGLVGTELPNIHGRKKLKPFFDELHLRNIHRDNAERLLGVFAHVKLDELDYLVRFDGAVPLPCTLGIDRVRHVMQPGLRFELELGRFLRL